MDFVTWIAIAIAVIVLAYIVWVFRKETTEKHTHTDYSQPSETKTITADDGITVQITDTYIKLTWEEVPYLKVTHVFCEGAEIGTTTTNSYTDYHVVNNVHYSIVHDYLEPEVDLVDSDLQEEPIKPAGASVDDSGNATLSGSLVKTEETPLSKPVETVAKPKKKSPPIRKADYPGQFSGILRSNLKEIHKANKSGESVSSLAHRYMISRDTVTKIISYVDAQKTKH